MQILHAREEIWNCSISLSALWRIKELVTFRRWKFLSKLAVVFLKRLSLSQFSNTSLSTPSIVVEMITLSLKTMCYCLSQLPPIWNQPLTIFIQATNFEGPTQFSILKYKYKIEIKIQRKVQRKMPKSPLLESKKVCLVQTWQIQIQM